MKKLLYTLLAVISVSAAKAQQPIKISSPTEFLKYIRVDGYVVAPIYYQGTNGNTTQDTLATRAYARQFGGTGFPFIQGYAIKISGDTISIDSLNYRKLDSMYVLNDTTIITKNNGAIQTYTIRGAVFSFNGRRGAVVPMNGDYRQYYVQLDSSYNDPSWLNSFNFSKLTARPNSVAGYGILDALLNTGNAYGWGSGPYSSRPAQGHLGSFYYSTDSLAIYYDNGTAWVKVVTTGATGTLFGPLTAGTIPYAQTSTKLGAAPIINDTTNSRIQLNVSMLVNSTGASILDKGNTAQRPSSPATGMIRFNTDSASYEQYTGSSWQKMIGGTGGGGSSGTVTSIVFGRGLNGGTITSSGNVSVDTTIIPRFADTLTTLVTKTFLSTRNYLTAETDPIANARLITLNQVTGGGVTVVGTSAQGLGTSPVWTVKADTGILATKNDLRTGSLLVGGTKGNLTYLTANNTLYTAPITYDSTGGFITLSKTLKFDGTVLNPFLYNITNATTNMLIVSGTKTNAALASWQESVTSPLGLYHINQNGSTTSGAWLSDQWLTGGRNDITHFDTWTNSSTAYVHGLRNVGGLGRYDFAVSALPSSVPFDFSKATIDIMQFDSLGRIYIMNPPRTGSSGDSLLVRSSGGELKYIAQTVITGTLNRIGLLDSLSRVSNGAQISGTGIYLQTADNLTSGGTNAGLISASFNKTVDSIQKRLPLTTWHLSHPGAGVWSIYSSPDGLTLFGKNLQGSNGITVATQTDSSVKWAPDYTYLVGVTNTQTLTNKTLTTPVLGGISSSNDTTTYKPLSIDASGNLRRNTSWPGSGGVGAQNLSLVQTAAGDTVKISGGTSAFLPSATHSLAGAMSAAISARVDSILNLTWYGHGHQLPIVNYTVDSLIFPGLDVTVSATGGLGVTYVGNRDSLAWRIGITAMTANGDLLWYNNGVTRLAAGAVNQVLTVTSAGTLGWVTPAASSGGTVTSVGPASASNNMFTTTITNQTTTPNITFALQNAPANTVFGSLAGGAPGYFNLNLTSSMFANEGSTTTVYHGNTSGNGSFGPVNMATDVTGTMLANQFPALTGAITTVAGSLNTALSNNAVTTAAIAANAVDLATKVMGIGSPANGFTGVNNGTKTITLGGNFATSGAFATTLTVTGATNVTLPTSGTLLATNGSGAALTGVVRSLTGTANQILVNGTTGSAQTLALTLTTAQDIGTTSSPIFTDVSITGPPAGSTTDNIVVQNPSGGALRVIPQAAFLNAAPLADMTATPTTNAVSPTAKVRYTIVDSVVTLSASGNWDCTTANSFSQITVTLPVNGAYSGLEGASYIGTGTWYSAGTQDFVPIQVRLASANTMVLYCKPTQTISTQYSVFVQYHM